MSTNINDKIIVALDEPNLLKQIEIVNKLGSEINFYKIGLTSLSTGGLGLANELKSQGKKIFLDLKLFDIGNTVEIAVKGLSEFDLDFLTVHGDPHVIQAAVKGKGDSSLKILAVTLLTSLNRDDLNRSLIQKGTIKNLVNERARLAFDSGADGVICSPQEITGIRDQKNSNGKIIVTPGIRPKGSEINDQKRISDPEKAFRAGADYIVIGRPITKSKNPLDKVMQIKTEIMKQCI